MSLNFLTVSGFRCLNDLQIEPDPRINLILGPNASGKTSLLESLFYLGRGRSFRLAGNRELVQTGRPGFTIFGSLDTGTPTDHSIGVEVTGGQKRIRVDAQTGTGADLARLLPLQVIDPEVHELIQGGPELRRRFLDWGVFHVKPGFLEAWRAYQQALRQRNAALRQNEPDELVRLWDSALVSYGEIVDRLRTEFLADFLPVFASIVDDKLSFDANCSYKRGWVSNASLAEALQDGLARDRAFGSTQSGPHRADLGLEVADRRARHRVSRGQQKILAASLVIVQTRFVAEQTAITPLLLVDDPSAELDRLNRDRLFNLLQDMPAQLFVTALEASDVPWSGKGQVMQLEHGKVVSLL